MKPQVTRISNPQSTPHRGVRARHKVALLALSAPLLVAAAALWAGSGARPADAPADPGSVAVPAGAAPDRVDLLLRDELEPERAAGWYSAPAGTQLGYDVKLRFAQSLKLDPGEVRCDGDLDTSADANGRLCVTVLDRRGDEVAVAVQFRELALAVAGTENDETENRRQAALRRTLVRLHADGTIAGYRFDEDLDGAQRNFLRTVVSAFAFTVPVDAAAEWDCQGADATGVFGARYRGTPAPDADATVLQVTRQKLGYVALSAGPDVVREHGFEGQARARLSTEAGWLTEARIDETLTMELPAFNVTLVCRVAGSAVLADRERVPFEFDPALWDATWAPPSGACEDQEGAAAERERAEWQRRLAGVELPDLIGRLRAVLEQHGQGSEEAYAAFTELSWLCRLRPGLAGELCKLAVESSDDADFTALLLSTLGNAGTTEAQDALARLFADPATMDGVREASAFAMFQLAKPTAELVGGLCAHLECVQQMDSFDATAMLLLGALAPRSEGALWDDVEARDVLLGFEQRARELGAVDVWLEALGNAGLPQGLEPARRYLDDPVDYVREAAVDALRKLDTPEASALLARKALGDPSTDVRRRAVDALSMRRDEGARQALHRVAAEDLDPDVRSAAIAAIGEGLAHDREGRALLERLARADSSPTVRELARQVLGSGG